MMHVIIIVVSEHGFWISALSTFVSGYFPVVGVSCASQDIEQHLWSPSTRCNSSPPAITPKMTPSIVHVPYRESLPIENHCVRDEVVSCNSAVGEICFPFLIYFFYHLKFYPNITENLDVLGIEAMCSNFEEESDGEHTPIDFKRNGSHQSCFTTDGLPSSARESGMGANEDSAIQGVGRALPGSLETEVPGTGPAPPACSLPCTGPRGGSYGMPPSKSYFQLECKEAFRKHIFASVLLLVSTFQASGMSITPQSSTTSRAAPRKCHP
ncbi:uncharacterized protein LOC102152866 isoform X2 [Canis lupus familiaris]|uniref:uncharacterized protein LOC102152866 isoform X2 n=1 Tax=Canis lupus familiaris TaxID=9615 RepID=UPI0003AD790B|nr:uncharacterized protein LOC102152866 isoform X2 [Canis lupus familiaris]XP_038320850.1 uncharacterized protein LOC102152866 isoform X2 [Canis lupus familiaris]|eukprot:XP_022271605.1 uncharacterized protein LOC102152866 isoform X2 [Canis lupus familiaris]